MMFRPKFRPKPWHVLLLYSCAVITLLWIAILTLQRKGIFSRPWYVDAVIASFYTLAVAQSAWQVHKNGFGPRSPVRFRANAVILAALSILSLLLISACQTGRAPEFLTGWFWLFLPFRAAGIFCLGALMFWGNFNLARIAVLGLCRSKN